MVANDPNHVNRFSAIWETESDYISGNGNGNGNGNGPAPKPRPPKTASNPHVQGWTWTYPALTRLAGGGLPALLASRVYYWSALGENRRLRAKRQPMPNRPVCTVYRQQLAAEIGLTRKAGSWDRSAARRSLLRSIQYLERQDVIRRGKTKRGQEILMLTGAALMNLEKHGLVEILRYDDNHPKAEQPYGSLMTPKKTKQKIKVYLHEVEAYGFNAALVLSHLLYYQQLQGKQGMGRARRNNYEHDGKRWIVRSRTVLSQETGLTERQARCAISTLIAAGAITSVNQKAFKSPRHLFRFTKPQLAKMLQGRDNAAYEIRYQKPY